MLRRHLLIALTIALLATTAPGTALALEEVEDDTSSSLDAINDTAENDGDANYSLTASTCDIDREANTITCPAPPTCETDEDCHLPDACTLEASTLVCTIGHETDAEPLCRLSTDTNASIECDIPPDCEDRMGQPGCAIPSSCNVRDGLIYCTPTRDDDAATIPQRPDCRPLNNTVLECSPPSACLEEDELLDACTMPSSCEETSDDRYRCTISSRNDTHPANATDAVDIDEVHDVIPRLHEHVRDHFDAYRADVHEAQEAYHDHQATLQERFNATQDELREAYDACLDETPTNATSEERHKHQRACLEEARESLTEHREALMQEHRQQRAALLDDLDAVKQEACQKIHTSLSQALEDAGIPADRLPAAIKPTQIPLCSSLFLEETPNADLGLLGDNETEVKVI